jgi:excisionase family DNA binding protein
MAVNELDLLWGSKAIGEELGLSQRQVYWLLEAGRVPATKVGRRWCASRVVLKQHFDSIVRAAATGSPGAMAGR